jgi:hypothetical protein
MDRLTPDARSRSKWRSIWILTRQISSIFLVLSLVSVSLAGAKKDRNQPHGHWGKLPPYKPGPFAIRLSGNDEKELSSGHSVMKQSQQGTSGGAICVQDVAAPKQVVWKQILDLDNYTKKVNKVLVSKNYHVSRNPMTHIQKIKTRMVLGVLPGYSVRSCFRMKIHSRFTRLNIPFCSTSRITIILTTKTRIPFAGPWTTTRLATLTT